MRKSILIDTVVLCAIATVWWMLSRIRVDSGESLTTTKVATPAVKTSVAETSTTAGHSEAPKKPPISPLPLIQTAFRRELGIKQEDIRKLWDEHVLWAGADHTDTRRIALFLKPVPDVEVGVNYDIYPVGEYSGQSASTISPLFRETSRNKILLCSIGTKLKPRGQLAEPNEGMVLFGHEYVFRWWDQKGPAGEIRFRTPDGPEDEVKDYSMDLILTADGLYSKKE